MRQKVSVHWKCPLCGTPIGRLGCEARHDVADGIQIDGRFHLSKWIVKSALQAL